MHNTRQDEAEFVKEVGVRFSASKRKSMRWRKEAKRAIEFVASSPDANDITSGTSQWRREDLATLERRSAPAITMNRITVFVQAVCGLQRINRQEVRYKPRAGSDRIGMADNLNEVKDYVEDYAGMEYVESDAFLDLVQTGMGFRETYVDDLLEDEPQIMGQRIDGMREMFWDHRARQRCLRDAKWMARLKEMSKNEIEERWGKAKADACTEKGVFKPPELGEEGQDTHHADEAWKYENDQSHKVDFYEDDDPRRWVLQYQYIVAEKFYRVPLPDGVKLIPEREWAEFMGNAPADLRALVEQAGPRKVRKARYHQAWICGKTLLSDEPGPSRKGFTFHALTGMWDGNLQHWYGLVRNLMDPQRWVNSLYSQIMWIMQSNAKGGGMYETGTVDDPAKFEATWAESNSWLEVNDGALRDGRITPKPTAPYPQGLDRLLEMAMQMFPHLTGVSLELLGLTDKVQPGVLESQRKQAGISILAWAFDSAKSSRHHYGVVLADMVRTYLADGREIYTKQKNPDGSQRVLSLTEENLPLESDVIIDDAPHSVNEKERVLVMLQQLLPAIEKLGVMPPVEILDYLPLPEVLTEKWKAQLTSKEAQQKGEQDQMLALQTAMAELRETLSRAAKNEASAQKIQLETMTGG